MFIWDWFTGVLGYLGKYLTLKYVEDLVSIIFVIRQWEHCAFIVHA